MADSSAIKFIMLFLLGTNLVYCERPGSLEIRYQRILAASTEYGEGGAAVLQAAYEALQEGDYSLAGIEDLWATALKEGRTLFKSKRMWSATGPQQTGDMLGQTTIGPWQITLENAMNYGKSYGIASSWNADEVVFFLESRPKLQAHLAADFIEESYREHGKRAPHAIQRYFWLEAFLQKKIGQGPWYESVLAKDPDEMQKTGFYAKQILLGSRFNPQGLLFWLYVSGDEPAIRRILAVWSDSGYSITKDDLFHCGCDPAFRHYLEQLL